MNLYTVYFLLNKQTLKIIRSIFGFKFDVKFYDHNIFEKSLAKKL